MSILRPLRDHPLRRNSLLYYGGMLAWTEGSSARCRISPDGFLVELPSRQKSTHTSRLLLDALSDIVSIHGYMGK